MRRIEEATNGNIGTMAAPNRTITALWSTGRVLHPLDMLEGGGDVCERRHVGRAQQARLLRRGRPQPLLIERAVVPPDQQTEIQHALEAALHNFLEKTSSGASRNASDRATKTARWYFKLLTDSPA